MLAQFMSAQISCISAPQRATEKIFYEKFISIKFPAEWCHRIKWGLIDSSATGRRRPPFPVGKSFVPTVCCYGESKTNPFLYFMKKANSRTGTVDAGRLTNRRPWPVKVVELDGRNIYATNRRKKHKNEAAGQEASSIRNPHSTGRLEFPLGSSFGNLRRICKLFHTIADDLRKN